MTSQLKPSRIIGEVIIQDWQAAGLLKPSAIKAMGRLKSGDSAALKESLEKIPG